MKIKFTKLPTNDGTIKISLDGGQSFTDYNVADVHESGIPLADSQDYEKIQIQAPANILKNLNVVSSVKVEGVEGGESGVSYTFEKDIFEEREVTYYCFAQDNDGNGEIEDNELHSNFHIWVKELTPNAKLEPFVTYELSPGIPDTSDSLLSIHTIYPGNEDFVKLNDDKSGLFVVWINEDGEEVIDTVTYLRYPEGDLTGTSLVKVKVGTETVTEVITEIQEEPTITENGQTIADEGKAFKSVKVNGVAELYKYFFDCGSWNNEVYSTLNKPFLEEGDLVMSIDGCWGGISIWQLDSNEMKIPEFPKFVGFTSLAEIMRKNIAASNQPH